MKYLKTLVVLLVLCLMSMTAAAICTDGTCTVPQKNNCAKCTNCTTCPTCPECINCANCTIVSPHLGNTFFVGSNYHNLKLVNNPTASDPTYAQLVEFIKSDKTDQKRYIYGKYMCSEFARDVHNNAEKAGIKAAWVSIDFKRGAGHACNAFNTTDRGLMYIDCTGSPRPSKAVGWDTTVDLTKGKKYQPRSLYPPNFNYYSTGIVKKFDVFW